MPSFGISVALLTPFASDGAIDAARLSKHANDMLVRGASSVTLFGTTGEGASISRTERAVGLEALIGGGVPADRINLGLCGSAVDDVVEQVAQGMAHGATLFLLAPPFYFSSATEDGLFDWHEALFQRTPGEARFILYNIPQVTGVAVTPGLTARLAAAYPNRMAGIKDSSGDWSSACAFMALDGLTVLIGDERLLHRAVPKGCAGSITGMANLYPERLVRVIETAREDAELLRIVDRVVSGPVNPSLKVLLAHSLRDPDWERVRPPLSPLEPEERSGLLHSVSEAHANG